MKLKFLALLAALSIVSLGLPGAGATAQPLDNPLEERYCDAPICAGYGEADATWHVGAGAGQYSNKNPDNVVNSVGDGEVDPHGHSILQQDSYGVQSRLSYRTIVVEDAAGDQVAFVKADSYLSMDYLIRRAGQILLTSGSKIQYEEIFHMASHNHSSPYYMTPSPGPWIFQDAFDLRAFEYHARAIANSILAAEEATVPARMGATTVTHKLFKGTIQRKGISDDGTPRGYPDDFGDFGLSVVRFDDLSDEADPKPLATLINWGQHPEGLDNHDLITGDFVASLERFVERDTGAPLVFGQGDVGSAEAGPGHPQEVADLGITPRWSHAGHAQGERGAYLLSRDVVEGFNQIASGNPLVPYSNDFDVAAGNAFVAGPYSHPYPAANACRTETTIEGNPGVGTAADCTRPHDFGGPDPQLWEKLKEAGVPIPDNYDTPSYFALEENTRLHLQAFKLGEVVLASCACEAQVDLILNFETRANKEQGDIWDGFDWTEPTTNPSTGESMPAAMDCTQDEESGDWTCVRNPEYPHPRAVLAEFTATDLEYRRMKAQIHNDAAGWDDPENTIRAISEPNDPEQILGNFTKEELSADLGYKLPIGVGHAGDYNGYTVSYREFMSWDDYRKTLTSYGAHTADYMSSRMVRLAATLNGAEDLELQADIARGLPDEARQLAMSTALGATSGGFYEAWTRSLPPDKNTQDDPVGEAIEQPVDIKRFDAATFSWRGGSNATDNPVVTVERLVDGEWTPFADHSGEIQTKLDFPNGIDAFANTYGGTHDWIWTANFEAFNANPAGIGSTPEGEYRFVVDGTFRSAPATDGSYEVVSEPFTVSRWDGINVRGLTVGEDGSVSFTVDPILYPHTYESVFPYIKDSGDTPQGDGVIKNDELGQPFCTTCTFRPWASGGEVETATVTVERADSTTETIAATKGEDGSWHADTDLFEGDRAYVAEGGVVDNYGERNAARSGEAQGTRSRPTPSETPSEDPGPELTSISFTDRSDEGGQYSDEALIEAKLATMDGDPIAGAELQFGIIETGETWTETTNAEGVAGRTIELTQQPGHYGITVHFAGSDDHAASGNTTSLVIDKEDSALALELKGKGSKRTLDASLADEDSPQSGVPGALLEFFADGEKIGEAHTNDEGRASIDVPPRYQGGHHTYRAEFSGDDFYKPSSASTSS